ncbi:MAG: hypothetical protein RLY86_3841 [Pseudomonadota bacterium]|jgi:hypothetical protein
MLDAIMTDEIDRLSIANQPIFSKDVDYEEIVKRKNQAMEKWAQLGESERRNFRNQEHFLEKEGVPDLKDPILLPARHYSLMVREIRSRIQSENYLQLLPLDGIDYDNSVLELAESIENAPHIQELYRLRKKTVGTSKNAGIATDEAGRLKNCLTQGRELYIAGRNGSLMVKPLNFFYALTAYSYATIILNNPLRISKGNLPQSHGMTYMPSVVKAQFGGDTARGTFSDLVTAFPTQLIKGRNLEINQDCSNSLYDFYQTRFTVSTGTLLSMVPEMAEYYKLITGRNSRSHPLEIVNANDPRMLKWEFQIGNGEHKPSPKSIEDSFSGFTVNDRHGKFVISVPATEAHKIQACIYTDIRGKFWFIENPFFPVILPEIAVHFLITNVFSCIMRYRPEEWGNVLLNEVSSGVSLLTRHYFSSFERKFFLLILRSVSKYIPYVS